MNPVVIAALVAGGAYFVLRNKNAPPSKDIAQLPIIQPSLAPQGYGAEVYLTFNPNDTSVSQNVRSLRFIGISSLIPSDVQGNPQNPDYMANVRNFQAFVGLPQTGTVDPTTQATLVKQVQARNAQVHNDNVQKGLLDTDWVAYQNKLGAQDSRGAWSLDG